MNIFHNRPLFTATLSFLITAVISIKLIHHRYMCIALLALAFLSLFAALSLKFLKRKSKAGIVNTVILSLVFSIVAILSQLCYSSKCVSYDSYERLEDVVIVATVKEITYEKDSSMFFIARTQTVGGEALANDFKFEYFGKTKLSIGDNFVCTGSITPFIDDGISQDETFDYSKGATAEVTDITKIEKLSEKKHSLFRALGNARSFAESKILNNSNSDGRALISSLLLGKTDSLSSAVRSNFKALGISHILAISGMHISILAFGLQYLLTLLQASKRTRLLFLLTTIFFYITISGMSVSATRAALMFAVVSLSSFARRDTDSYTSLCLSVCIITLAQPYAILDIGLWLSFLATFGIITAITITDNRKCEQFSKVMNVVVNYVRASLLATTFAFMFTLPIVCFVFGYISSLTLVTNLLFSTLTQILMYMSFLIPISFFSEAYINICGKFSDVILLIASKLAKIPFAVISVSYTVFIIAVIVFSVYVLLLLAQAKESRESILRKLAISFSMLMIVLAGCVIHNSNITRAYYISHPENSSEFIIIKDKNSVTAFDMSDASNSSILTFSDECTSKNIRYIDNYVLSHYSTRYINSLNKLNSYIKIKRVLLPYPDTEQEYSIAANIIEALENLNIEVVTYRKNTTVEIGNVQYLLNAFEKEKYSNVLHINAKYTTITYFTPQVISCMNSDEIEHEIYFSNIVIIGKHGGSYDTPLNFSLPSQLHHIIISNNSVPLTKEFADTVKKSNGKISFNSTKIKIQ